MMLAACLRTILTILDLELEAEAEETASSRGREEYQRYKVQRALARGSYRALIQPVISCMAKRAKPGSAEVDQEIRCHLHFHSREAAAAALNCLQLTVEGDAIEESKQ